MIGPWGDEQEQLAGSTNRERSMKTLVFLFSIASLTLLFLANRWWAYSDMQGDLRGLTAGHIADPRSAGTTFRFQGGVKYLRMTPTGIMLIELHDPEGDVHLDVPVFPSLGRLPIKPVRGETVRVTGNLGMYRGQPQLKPLSAAHVEVLTPPAAEQAVPLARATKRTGERLLVGPVKAVGAEPFTSRRGLRHVRLTLADPAAPANETVQGVMFQGDRTHHEVQLLSSGAPVIVTAEIDVYQGRPSLIVKRVVGIE